MAKKRNIIVGQSGGPTAVINSSLAGVYKTAKERGFHKVYGMLHGIEGFLDEMYVDLSTQIHSDMDIELLKRTPSAFLGSCRYKLPDIHENPDIYETIFYKEVPVVNGNMDEIVIVTYSPKYKAYQKRIREQQISRAVKMMEQTKEKITSPFRIHGKIFRN